MTKVFFPGSFNPFTIGHLSVLERALKLFDNVVVGIGYNPSKPQSSADAEMRAESLRLTLAPLSDRVEVTVFDGATVQACRKHAATAILRGVRSVADFEYERTMADVNRRIAGIDTVILFALPEHSMVSSSIVRELIQLGMDVSELLPPLPATHK